MDKAHITLVAIRCIFIVFMALPTLDLQSFMIMIILHIMLIQITAPILLDLYMLEAGLETMEIKDYTMKVMAITGTQRVMIIGIWQETTRAILELF